MSQIREVNEDAEELQADLEKLIEDNPGQDLYKYTLRATKYVGSPGLYLDVIEKAFTGLGKKYSYKVTDYDSPCFASCCCTEKYVYIIFKILGKKN